MDAQRHTPVLAAEVLEGLDPRAGLFVDCTLGMGGHAEVLLDRAPSARLIGLDRDAESLALATERLARFKDRFTGVHADYRGLTEVLDRYAPGEPVVGLLADLGVSSYQLDAPERGFAFSREAPLDMRMDRSGGKTAAQLVNELRETDLANLIYRYGEEPRSRRIARAICRARERRPIETTTELADIVARAAGIPRHAQRIHPATRTFQALRIAVNEELEGLGQFLHTAVDRLSAPGGRIVIIAFHSLEDRVVKRTFKVLSGACVCPPGLPTCVCGRRKVLRLLNRKPVAPSEGEIEANPRARSARLRAAERT